MYTETTPSRRQNDLHRSSAQNSRTKQTRVFDSLTNVFNAWAETRRIYLLSGEISTAAEAITGRRMEVLSVRWNNLVAVRFKIQAVIKQLATGPNYGERPQN